MTRLEYISLIQWVVIAGLLYVCLSDLKQFTGGQFYQTKIDSLEAVNVASQKRERALYLLNDSLKKEQARRMDSVMARRPGYAQNENKYDEISAFILGAHDTTYYMYLTNRQIPVNY